MLCTLFITYYITALTYTATQLEFTNYSSEKAFSLQEKTFTASTKIITFIPSTAHTLKPSSSSLTNFLSISAQPCTLDKKTPPDSSTFSARPLLIQSEYQSINPIMSSSERSLSQPSYVEITWDQTKQGKKRLFPLRNISEDSPFSLTKASQVKPTPSMSPIQKRTSIYPSFSSSIPSRRPSKNPTIKLTLPPTAKPTSKPVLPSHSKSY